MQEEEGAQMLETILRKQNQFEVPRIPDRTKFLTWPLYMLDVFRILRAADKKSWHHRIVNRVSLSRPLCAFDTNNLTQAAELIYRIPEDPQERAHFAKDYLVDQHVYTKSYTITIWKPEHERPGRHWVYMTKYASFVARIFEETDDLEGMEILARRIRRKPNEYYEHTALWEEVCGLHLKVRISTHAGMHIQLISTLVAPSTRESSGQLRGQCFHQHRHGRVQRQCKAHRCMGALTYQRSPFERRSTRNSRAQETQWRPDEDSSD